MIDEQTQANIDAIRNELAKLRRLERAVEKWADTSKGDEEADLLLYDEWLVYIGELRP